LLVTDLSSDAIVYGKLAARWSYTLVALLTGVPVLSLMLCWGGIDPLRLAAGFVVAILSALSLAALSLYCSLRAPSVPSAVASTYLRAVLYYGLTFWCFPVNPFALVAELFDAAVGDQEIVCATATFAFSQLTLTVVLAGVTVNRLRCDPGAGGKKRLSAPHDQIVIEKTDREEGPATGLDAQLSTFFGWERVPSPIFAGDPVLWKETHFRGVAHRDLLWSVGAFLTLAVLALAVPVVLMALGASLESTNVSAQLQPLVGLLTWFLLAAISLGGTFHAAGSVSREVERRTLDGLLALPDGRAPILRAKWLSAVHRVRVPAIGLAVLVVVGGLTHSVNKVALPFLVSAPVAQFTFFVSLGIYLSVVSRSTSRACLIAAAWLLGLSLLPPLVAAYWTTLVDPVLGGAGRWVGWLLEDGLSPPVVWWRLAFADTTLQPSARDGLMVGIAVYAAAGALTWRQARLQFRREADGDRG
jgi:ABC-type transport system involved in multi-copper enzyme maturation permease subunit